MTQLRRLARPELGLHPFLAEGKSFSWTNQKQIDEPSTAVIEHIPDMLYDR